MAYEGVISGDERDRLILVVPQGRHANDGAPMSFRSRLGDNDPEVWNYIRSRCRDQEGVAATHPRVSTTPYKCLHYSKTLNLAFKVRNFRVGPIRRSEDVAVRNRDRTPLRVLPLWQVVRKFHKIPATLSPVFGKDLSDQRFFRRRQLIIPGIAI
jgi:hypothetical protein